MMRDWPTSDDELIPLEPEARFGGEEEATAAAAAGGGGGGGGGGGAGAAGAVGAVMQGAAMLVQAIGGVALQAADREGRPDVMAKRHTTRFERVYSGLQRIKAERAEARRDLDAAVAWLRDPNNHVQWMSGPAAMTAAPKGQVLCDPLFPPAPTMPQKARSRSPGGHAAANPACKCPTAPCAFRDRAKGDLPGWLLQAAEAERKIAGIEVGGHGRSQVLDVEVEADVHNLGTMREFTREARRSWTFLMSLEGLHPVLLASGMTAIWRTPLLFSPEVIKDLFIRFEPPFPNDPEALQGKVPAVVGRGILEMTLALYGMGMLPESYPVPLWVFTGDPEGIGPTIGQVAAVQAQMLQGSTAAGAGGGADLRGRVRYMIETGEVLRVPSVPADHPAVQAVVQVHQAGVQAALRPPFREAHPILFWSGVGAGSLAAVGGAIWAGLKLSRP